jgi:hypothetical protein
MSDALHCEDLEAARPAKPPTIAARPITASWL